MEIDSLKSLTELAERAEDLFARLSDLDLLDGNVQMPNLPFPFELNSVEEWLKLANECIRKPRLSRSKLLLESKEIDTVPIAASVLDNPETLMELVAKIDQLPSELRQMAFASFGRALTKGLSDAASIADRFSHAANAIKEIEIAAKGREWVYRAAISQMSANLESSDEATAETRKVLELCSAAERVGVQVAAFSTLKSACEALSTLIRKATEYEQLLAVEGLLAERVSIDGFDVPTALNKLQADEERLRIEKQDLGDQLHNLQVQLDAIGAHYGHSSTSIAELRQSVLAAHTTLNQRRGELRTELGPEAFNVVEALMAGKFPSSNEVSDTEFGSALRRAFDCGYRIQIEAPHED